MEYPKATIWQDSSSFGEDEMYDFYIMIDKWIFLERATHFINLKYTNVNNFDASTHGC